MTWMFEDFSLDALLADPAKAVMLPSKRAQGLLIELASLQAVLLQRALSRPSNDMEEELLLTIPEVAKRLKVSDYKAYELARQGNLKCVRLGKSVRVKPSAIDDYLSRHVP
jgi:excisionase family DNA binding protein